MAQEATFFFQTLKQERTLKSAYGDLGELSREAHDLCCWPLQAREIRAKADALRAEIKTFETA